MHWQRLAFAASVRSKKKKKEEFEEEGSKEDGDKAPAAILLQRHGKFQRASKLMPIWCYGNNHNSVVNQDFSKRFSMAYF